MRAPEKLSSPRIRFAWGFDAGRHAQTSRKFRAFHDAHNGPARSAAYKAGYDAGLYDLSPSVDAAWEAYTGATRRVV